VDFNISSDWKEAFNGEIVITNISDQTIEDWSLEFDFDKNISSFWTADIANHEGNHYSIVNKGYNANIAPGASVSLGFRGEPGDVTCSPENFILQKYQIANPHQKVLSYIMANPEDDYDGDGLLNSFEIDAYGCTNPMKADSDDDGISDGDEDHDLDGLSNFNEQKNGTNPIDKDTDKDGLSDGFEINTYQTLPNKYDTDDDGLNDGDEYKLGTNPNNPDSDNDGIIDSQEIYEQSMTETFISADKPEITSVTVNFGTNENIERTTTITNTYGIDIRTSDVVGLVGSPVDIETSSTFSQATITFGYNEVALGDVNEDDLGILWYNEEENKFILLESYLDKENNVISFETTHFSIYMVIDKAKWFELWNQDLDYTREPGSGIPSEDTQYYDIVFAIDSSGSMSSNDPSGLRKEAAKEFVDAFYSQDQGAVVDFDSSAYIRVHLTKDKDSIKAAINSIDASGNTNINNAVSLSIDELLSTYAIEDNKKIIILLTDGNGTYYNTTTTRAIENDITIYTIGLGNGVNGALLDTIATSTGGKYYQAAESEELRGIFFGIGEETVGDGQIDTTDTDGDGIYDTYEIVGMKTPKGIIYSDPLKADTDGDGINDGEEMGGFGYSDSATEWEFNMKSNPNEKDSDYDGFDDNIDTEPFINYFRHITDSDVDLIYNAIKCLQEIEFQYRINESWLSQESRKEYYRKLLLGYQTMLLSNKIFVNDQEAFDYLFQFCIDEKPVHQFSILELETILKDNNSKVKQIYNNRIWEDYTNVLTITASAAVVAVVAYYAAPVILEGGALAVSFFGAGAASIMNSLNNFFPMIQFAGVGGTFGGTFVYQEAIAIQLGAVGACVTDLNLVLTINQNNILFATNNLMGGMNLPDGMGSYSSQGGHHPMSKVAFTGNDKYDPEGALTISPEKLQEFGVKHTTITGQQNKLYTEFAKTGKELTLKAMQEIEVKALTNSGIPEDYAKLFVNKAIEQLVKWGVTEPSQIPWN
jgi:hypothetical protein